MVTIMKKVNKIDRALKAEWKAARGAQARRIEKRMAALDHFVAVIHGYADRTPADYRMAKFVDQWNG